MSALSESTFGALKAEPSKFVGGLIGQKVTVKLHNGVRYEGKLQSIDGFMNVVLEDGKEVINGAVNRNYGDIFVRGNNVSYISDE